MADKTALILCVNEIYKKYSDAAHPLPRLKVCEELEKRYGYNNVSERTLSRYLTELETMGYPLHRIPNKGAYLEPVFTDVQAGLLAMPLLAARYLSEKNVEKLTQKLASELTDRQFKDCLKKLYFKKCYYHPARDTLECSFQTIYAAMQLGCKISFAYGDAWLHGTTVKRSHAGRGEKNFLSPYSMFYANETFFMVGKNDAYADLSHYSIDKMLGVTLTEDRAVPYGSLPGCYGRQFSTENYLHDHYKMIAGGRPETLHLRVRASKPNQIRYHYSLVKREMGNRIIREEESGSLSVDVWVRLSPAAAKILATHFCDFVEILDHKELRKNLHDMHLAEAKRYE